MDARGRIAAGPDPEAATTRLERFLDAGGAISDEELAAALFSQSPYLSAFVIRDPPALERLARDPFLRREKDEATFLAEARAQPGELKRALRHYRNTEYLRLGARELGYGRADEVGRELSHLAGALLEVAVEKISAQLIEKHGAPLRAGGERCRFVVFGMGKLGGEELNFSSDVDLIFLYDSDDGACASGLSLHEFFSRLAERVTAAIGDVTEDGFCFRVDLRLRPEGSRGPLTNSLGAAERYYEAWGRPWERQAWIKARPVAGDRDLGEEALRRFEPFVWPRGAGASAIASVHELMAKIRAELASPDDVKVGPGGIREVEFFVQALQMVHARQLPLRERSTRRALDKLLFAGIVTGDEHRALADAYQFLRKVEHRLQLDEGRQTHELPPRRDLLARRLGFPDEESFMRVLDEHRREVEEIYETLGAPEEAPPPEILTLLDAAADREAISSALERLEFAEIDSSTDEIEMLRQKPRSPFVAGHAEPFAARLLDEVAHSPDPDLALRRLVDLVGRRGGGAGIWRLVEAHRPLATLLASLFGTSEYLGKAFIAHPELLEELLGAAQAQPKKSRAELDAKIERVLVGDDEEKLNALRRVKNEEVLRVGLFDVAGELAPTEVSQQLTDLAEALLEAALKMVGAPLVVLGLGTLGAREMTYASDLDLIFIHEGDEFDKMSRAAQKLLRNLTLYMDNGRLYEVDTRLRPSGQHGLLVSSLSAFREYHAREALLWERQALLRARVVAGNRALGDEVERAIENFLWHAPVRDDMAQEIGRLRARMEKELAHESAGRLNLKLGRGGLADVDFLVQYLQLREGPRLPSVRMRSTASALTALRDENVLAPDEAALLGESYAFLRRLENRLRIVHDRSIQELPQQAGELDKLARRLGYPGEQAGGRLLDDYRSHTQRVRALYARHLPAP